MRKFKAFTLIELLVVIAIIGILSTVVVVNVSGNTQKAKDISVLASLNSVQTAATSCVIGAADNLNPPVNTSSICVADTSTNWPNITANTSGWTYGVASAVSSTSFSIVANFGSPVTKTITCTQTGCTKTGF